MLLEFSPFSGLKVAVELLSCLTNEPRANFLGLGMNVLTDDAKNE